MQIKVNIFIKVLQIWNRCITFGYHLRNGYEPQTHRSTVFKNHRKVPTGRYHPISSRYRWIRFNYNSIIMKTFLTEGEVIELAYDALDMNCPDPDKVHDIALKMDMVYNEEMDMYEDVEQVYIRSFVKIGKWHYENKTIIL